MTLNRSKVIAAVFAVMLIVASAVALVVMSPASGTGGGHDEPDCNDPTITVVDQEAWTEVIPGEAEVWANFSPNNHKEPFVGPAVWPNDPRGTWHVHNKIPGGHEGPDGVYAKGNPAKGGNWFYRHNGTPDQVINHPEVTHEEPNPNYPCPTEPTDTPTEPTEPTEPTDEPTEPTEPTDEPTQPTEPPTTDEPTEPPTLIPPTSDVPDEPEPDGKTTRKCIGNALVIKKFDGHGNMVSSSTLNGHRACAEGQPDAPDQPVLEEGM